MRLLAPRALLAALAVAALGGGAQAGERAPIVIGATISQTVAEAAVKLSSR